MSKILIRTIFENKIFNFVTQCSLGWMWLCCWLFWLPFPCVLLAVFQFSHNFQNSILILWFRADFLFKLSNSELEDQCGCAAGAVLAPTAGTLCFLLHWGALLLQSQRSFISLNTRQNKPFSFWTAKAWNYLTAFIYPWTLQCKHGQRGLFECKSSYLYTVITWIED